ncbi:UDP-glycosyltransferase 72B1-like [Neltuma alba]|uniref:UDP-glycosyltransferase 72B1-like n=1 Tax=Neltuma alba TaxID=207710 RepID=UPI0010A2F540|nr:UDP-glycosyltransferase 72B1-like [Prosopis alba]
MQRETERQREIERETEREELKREIGRVDALEVAKQFNLKTYTYCASSGPSLSFFLNFPKLDKDLEILSTNFRELQQPVKLPSFKLFFVSLATLAISSLQGKDLIDSIQDRTSESYKTILHIRKGLDLADGIILNSFMDLERKSKSAGINETTSKCLKWLDNQPSKSVLYVSFGSGGTLSHDQLNKLALGLETNGHKFLWAVRAPNGYAYSAYLNEQKEDPFDYLPKGFLERIKDQGFVLPSWAPQIEMLRHQSTRAFLTHCGWNSTLECVFYGKPMIVWPLFAEQRMNAAMLSEELKIAVRPKENANNDGIIVEKEEVSRIVKSVMEGDEGKEINRRIQVFKDVAAKALGKDGSFSRILASLTNQWKNSNGK